MQTNLLCVRDKKKSFLLSRSFAMVANIRIIFILLATLSPTPIIAANVNKINIIDHKIEKTIYILLQAEEISY